MPENRLPSPRPIPDPTPGELVRASADLLPPDAHSIVVRDRWFPVIEPAVPLNFVGPPPPLPRPVLAARILCLFSAAALLSGLGAIIFGASGAHEVAASYVAGAGIVGLLITAPRSLRPDEEEADDDRSV